MKMATMDKIMTTSMATASTLISERMGRCNRLAKMSLFIPYDGSLGSKALQKSLRFKPNSPGLAGEDSDRYRQGQTRSRLGPGKPESIWVGQSAPILPK
jgi:hypothetical protein